MICTPISSISHHLALSSNVECVELLLERGAQPNDDMLHAAFDEARLGCLLKKIEPKEITTFLHSCIRSKGFVDPVLDKHRILPASRQLQSPSSTHSDPITVAKQANAIQSPSVRRSQQYVLYLFFVIMQLLALPSLHFPLQTSIYSGRLDQACRQRQLPRCQWNNLTHECLR
jgi:hypothetical protein